MAGLAYAADLPVKPGRADHGCMSDRLTQILPAVTALSGVALTLGGTILLERQKWRRSRRSQLADRAVEVFADLPQVITDISRTLRQAAERIAAGDLDFDALAESVDEQIGRARQLGAAARLIGPSTGFTLVDALEESLEPLYRLVADIAQAVDPADPSTLTHSDDLVEPAKGLIRRRDALIFELRKASVLGIDRLSS